MVDDMKGRIVDVIRECGGVGGRCTVSFVELSQRIEGFAGHHAFGVSGKNIWFWFGMSQEFVTALKALIDDGIVKMAASNLLVYLVDGQHLNIPIARRKCRYKKERWLPVVFGIEESARWHRSRASRRSSGQRAVATKTEINQIALEGPISVKSGD